MRKLIWIIVFTLLSCANTLAADVDVEPQTELLQVNTQITTLQKSIQQNKHLQSNLEQQLKLVEIRIGQLGEQIYQFNLALEKEHRIIADLKKQQLAYLNLLTVQDAALSNQIRAAYQLGDIQQWKILLNQDEPGSMSRHMTYYGYLNKARLKLILSIRQILADLATSIQISNAHEVILQKLVAQKKQQQNLEQRVFVLRQKLIVALGLQTKSKQQQINLLTTNQAALQKTLAKLKTQHIQLEGHSFLQQKGKLNWPVMGNLMSPFGTPLNLGTQKLNGVVIKAEPGAPVHAIYSGKIIFANWLRGFGLLIIINHGNNYMSLYARNRAIYAKVGSFVNAGDVIAATGSSGGYSKSSLYFEIRQNGTPLDPAVWCR